VSQHVIRPEATMAYGEPLV